MISHYWHPFSLFDIQKSSRMTFKWPARGLINFSTKTQNRQVGQGHEFGIRQKTMWIIAMMESLHHGVI